MSKSFGLLHFDGSMTHGCRDYWVADELINAPQESKIALTIKLDHFFVQGIFTCENITAIIEQTVDDLKGPKSNDPEKKQINLEIVGKYLL